MKNDLKIFTENVEGEALNQIYELIRTPPFEGEKVRIMPDVHYGKGCVVGFTSTTRDMLNPSVIGVDIGCGMLTVAIGKTELDFEKLDCFIKNNVPAGSRVHKKYTETEIFKRLKCFNALCDTDKLYRSMGTLGGGNHFIEIDRDGAGEYYLVIHTGSRNLGQQVERIYKKMAVESCKGAGDEEKNRAVYILSREGRQGDIPEELKRISESYSPLTKLPPVFCYLQGKEMEEYLHDVKVCQDFARMNRRFIADGILKFLKLRENYSFDTVHNYIDEKGIIRKGAISAEKNQRVIIPMNMRDGCIIAVGKGNPNWNCSAPHGAGRLYSRQKVRELFSLEEYTRQMEGIYSTTVSKATIDESPMAYKPTEEIMGLIGDTVDIVNIIKPAYNFKAGN